MYSPEACAAEVRLYMRVRTSPLIPNIFALLEKIKMGLVCHLIYLLFIFAILTSSHPVLRDGIPNPHELGSLFTESCLYELSPGQVLQTLRRQTPRAPRP